MFKLHRNGLFQWISTLTAMLFFITSTLGCSGGGSSSNTNNVNSGYIEQLSDITHLTKDAFEIDSDYTDHNGTAEVFIADIGRDLELTIIDEDGNPVPEMQVNFATIEGRLLISIDDPHQQYAPTIINIDTKDPNGLYYIGAYQPNIVISAAAITVGVIKLATLAYSTYKLAETAHRIYDFHVDNFESVSLRTVTYRATIGELGDLFASVAKGGLSVVSIAGVIGSGGATLAVPEEALYEVATNQTIGLIEEGIIAAVQHGVTAIGEYVIGEETEVYVKIHFWEGLIPPYKAGIEITPIFSTAPMPSKELIGTWDGQWNNVKIGASGRAKLVISSTTGYNFEGLLFDLEYSTTLSMPMTGNVNGTEITMHADDIEPSDGEDRSLDLIGTITGSSITIGWTMPTGEYGSMSYTKTTDAIPVNSYIADTQQDSQGLVFGE